MLSGVILSHVSSRLDSSLLEIPPAVYWPFLEKNGLVWSGCVAIRRYQDERDQPSNSPGFLRLRCTVVPSDLQLLKLDGKMEELLTLYP